MSDKATERADLVNILNQLDRIRANLDMECEKLQVALTGVFRLLGGEDSELLRSLGGRQQNLEAYTLKLISDLRRSSNDQLLQLRKTLEMTENPKSDP